MHRTLQLLYALVFLQTLVEDGGSKIDDRDLSSALFHAPSSGYLRQRLNRVTTRVESNRVLFGSEHADGIFAPSRRVDGLTDHLDRKSTRLNSSHSQISYAVFCLK